MKLFENKQTEKNKNKRTEVVPVVSVVPIATVVFVVPVAPGGGGGYFRNFWVGMCHWDPGTLNLYQS